jgi:hypothetical protein
MKNFCRVCDTLKLVMLRCYAVKGVLDKRTKTMPVRGPVKSFFKDFEINEFDIFGTFLSSMFFYVSLTHAPFCSSLSLSLPFSSISHSIVSSPLSRSLPLCLSLSLSPIHLESFYLSLSLSSSLLLPMQSTPLLKQSYFVKTDHLPENLSFCCLTSIGLFRFIRRIRFPLQILVFS